MAFDPQGRAFVSAPSPASTLEDPVNGIYLVDLDPGTPPDLVLEVPGYSGPLAFGADGALYVAPGVFGEPADVLRFRSAVVEQGIGSGVIGAGDGEVFAAGLPGAYDLVFGSFGLLMVGDSVGGQVLGLGPDGTVFPWAAPAAGYASATYVDYAPDSRTLGVINSDYATFNRLTLLTTEYRFRRGLVNGDEFLDLSDAVSILLFLFADGRYPPNLDRLDVNDSGGVEIGDAVYLLQYLFVSGPEPPAPFAAPGLDPTAGDPLGN
jgi:hypothetical protein